MGFPPPQKAEWGGSPGVCACRSRRCGRIPPGRGKGRAELREHGESGPGSRLTWLTLGAERARSREKGSCSAGRRIHWLVKIERLMASVPGFASGSADGLAAWPCLPPPSLRTGAAGGHTARPALMPSFPCCRSPLLSPACSARCGPARARFVVAKCLCTDGFPQMTV